MPQYLIESPHSKEECLKALDAVSEKEPQLLEKSWFGCKSGEHVEWATVEAGSAEEAKSMLPDFLRDKARVVEVGQVTPEQIREYHMK